jgi:hypothetical protein
MAQLTERKEIQTKLQVFTTKIQQYHMWDVMPCSPVAIHIQFGGTYCLHLQEKRYAKQATKKKETATLLLSVSWTLKMEAVSP